MALRNGLAELLLVVQKSPTGLLELLVGLAIVLPFLVYLIRPGLLWKSAFRFHPLTFVARSLPRALDAWVYAHPDARAKLFRRRGPEYVAMSVQVNGAPVPGFQAYSLQSAFDPPRTAILIWGDSGTGKTRLAHEFARLADTKYDNIRVARSHPMLPLFIDDDPFSYPAVNPSWSEAILTKLKTELGPESHPGLYLHLLESKRVLVLIDGLSEMSGKTQELLERDLPTLPARALILTSRRHERLRGVALTEIETGAIQSDRLAASIDECLRARNQRGLFPDDEYLESVPRLAKLASPSPVTMGLLTIYCDVLIAFKRSSPPSSPNLKDVVELMESYRDSQVLSENATKANELAWRCVSETLRPIAVTGEVENELAPLVWPVAPGRVHFRIPLLAEYLAAIHIAEVNGSSEESWRTFLASTQKVDGAPTSIRSFLNALRDVVAAKAGALRIPDAMLGEMIPVLGEPLPRVRGNSHQTGGRPRFEFVGRPRILRRNHPRTGRLRSRRPERCPGFKESRKTGTSSNRERFRHLHPSPSADGGLRADRSLLVAAIKRGAEPRRGDQPVARENQGLPAKRQPFDFQRNLDRSPLRPSRGTLGRFLPIHSPA